MESKERKIRTRKEIIKRKRQKERAIRSCNFSAFLGKKSGVNRVGSAVLIFLRFNLARHYVIFLRRERGKEGRGKISGVTNGKENRETRGNNR